LTAKLVIAEIGAGESAFDASIGMGHLITYPSLLQILILRSYNRNAMHMTHIIDERSLGSVFVSLSLVRCSKLAVYYAKEKEKKRKREFGV
jgi:hypothetical protein